MPSQLKKCVYPNNILIVSNNGDTISCPLESGNKKIANIHDGLLNSWNNKGYETFRNNLNEYLQDKSRVCWQCNKLEKNGANSLRKEFPLLSDQPSLKGIQFKLSNKCQLTCAHCGPLLSSSWAKFLGKSNIIQNFEMPDKVIDELSTLLPSLNFIRFTGGEPFVDPTHWKILERLENSKKGNCELHYITNGLGKVKTELWQSWPKVQIMLSVDGFKESYEWFRRGASWDKLIKNYELFKSLPNVKIKINFSVTPWTINYLADCKEYFQEDFITVPVMDPSHASLSSFTHDEYTRLGLTKYEKYSNIVGSNPKSTTYLKHWALQWDKRWNTIGQAEKIHPWLLEI